MRLLSAALWAAAACLASCSFRGDFSPIFNTWKPSEDVRFVDDFDHLTQIFHPQAHEEEHRRRKRNADETAKFAAGAPITHACSRPGYTGQYCEFPICEKVNPTPNPDQFLRDEGYVIDLTDLGNCTRQHKIIVDETMYDIRIDVQSLDNVSPQLTIVDENGYIGAPDQIVQEPDRYIAHFNKLPPGAYNVQPTAANINSRCILTTTAQTTLTISGGFQTDDRDRNDFPNDNAGAHQFNSIMLTLNGARAPATLKTVSVVGPENYVLRPRVLDKRYGCQYEFYFDSLFCYERGSYALIVDGIDFFGNLFRRVAPFECVYTPAPTTPSIAPTTPIPTNPTSCANGGVLLASRGKTTCVCQDHWTGYDCSQALCINGGTRLEGKCFCPVGFEGTHCEQVKCEPNSNHGFGVDRPTLVFVVRARVAQNPILVQVQRAIDDVVANMQFDPTYLTRFHLVIFNNHNIIKSKYYSSINDFDWDFELDATQSTDNFGGCNDDVLGAVAAALTDVSLTQGSTVYVITDALADDYTTEIDEIIQLNSFSRAAINFVYVEPTTSSKCVSDISDPGFRAFDEVANRFGGLAWHIQDRNNVYDVMYSHMNSILYKSQLMLTIDREECSKGLGKTIQVENNAETLIFVSRGRDFHLDITNPEGLPVKPMTLVQEGLFTVMRWGTPLAGTYLVKASTDAPTAACSLRAYQASVHTTTSNPQTEAYWAISTDVDTDAMMYQPVAGMDNHPVFHVEDFGDDAVDHAIAFLNMYAVRNGVEQEVYASNGLYRGGCTFQFYFPSFRCRANENLHYEFNLRNEQGFYVQRAGVMTCFNYIPTPSAPTDCQNGGVKYNGTCLCQSHYAGEHCDTLICENGGTTVFGNCQCPAGWTGPFCAYAQCSESGPLPTYGYHADMVFLVEVSQKGLQQINQLLLNLPDIIRDVQSQHRDWIDRLVLIGYNSQGVIAMVDKPIADTDLFFSTLLGWSNLTPNDECAAEIWLALDMLLNGRKDGDAKRVLPDRSIVNIIEASIPLYGYSDNSLIYDTSKTLLERRAIVNIFQGQNWNTANGKDCDGSENDFRWLSQVARRGDGRIYYLSNNDLGKAIRMIPTLFSSSIVYKYSSDDCSGQVNVFFPIDAYTQTVTTIISGQNAAIDMRRRDGTSMPAEMRVDIVDNDRNVIVEYRNPCDGDWEAVSQYCIYYSKAVARNFADAYNLCESMDAFMVDDLNEDKNRWLSLVLGERQAWLGLTYINGNWYFQQDNHGYTQPPANFNKWITGEAPADDSQGGCAYIFNGVWYPMFCDREYVVVCQKHMYNRHNEPSELGDSDLSPGHYYLVVQTKIGAGKTSCEVEIRVQSDLNVKFGFVDGLRKDETHPVANIDSYENRVVSSVSIGQARTQTSQLQEVMLRSDEHTSSILLEAATVSYRLGCSYEFVSQPLSCDLTHGLDFSVVMIGEDDTGNTFQRYSTSFCSKWYECQNGGVYSNGQCLCADYFTGDQCETPMCQNGGELAPGGTTCNCPTGFGGPACESARCSYKSRPAFTNDGKAFVFVLEKSANTADAIEKIGNDIDEIIETVRDKRVGWISRWMILSFAMDGSIDGLQVYYTDDKIQEQLLKVADEARALPGGCQMPIFKALGSLFDSPLAQFLAGSEVMIVSAAAPSDADLAAIHATMENFDIQTPVVDFLHIETLGCPIADWAKNLGDFADFISTTGGLVFRVPPANAALALSQFVPTRYAVQSLSYSDPLNCKDNDIYVQIDTSMTLFYVMVGSPNAKIKVTTPNKYEVYVFLMWNSDGQNLWSVYPKFPGIYKITVNADGPACFPIVYGSVGSLIYEGPHAAQVFSGFIQSSNTGDFPTPYAVYGAVNFPVFNLFVSEGAVLPPTEFLYTARMTRKTINGKDEESYTSDVDLRVNCAYTYVGKAFTCVEENDVITLSVSGVDSYSQPFTRQSTTYCKADGSTKNLQHANNTNERK